MTQNLSFTDQQIKYLSTTYPPSLDSSWIAICPLSNLSSSPSNPIIVKFPAILPKNLDLCLPELIPSIQGQKQVSLLLHPSSKKPRVLAFNSKCPHQGTIMEPPIFNDIEDLLTCPSHNWSFDIHTGQCTSNRYVLDIFTTKILPYTPSSDSQQEPWVFLSRFVVNEDIPGPRRDFNTKLQLSTE